MRPSASLSSPLVAATLLLVTACAGTQSRGSESAMIDHPMHTPLLVSTMMMEQEARALQDSAIVREMRERVGEWNQGNLDAFLAMYDPEAAYVAGDAYMSARDAIRQIHTARWFAAGATARAQLSFHLLGTETTRGDARLHVICWTATDGAGRQETWTSSLTFRFLPGAGWRVIHELSSLDDPQQGAASPVPDD